MMSSTHHDVIKYNYFCLSFVFLFTCSEYDFPFSGFREISSLVDWYNLGEQRITFYNLKQGLYSTINTYKIYFMDNNNIDNKKT